MLLGGDLGNAMNNLADFCHKIVRFLCIIHLKLVYTVLKGFFYQNGIIVAC